MKSQSAAGNDVNGCAAAVAVSVSIAIRYTEDERSLLTRRVADCRESYKCGINAVFVWYFLFV